MKILFATQNSNKQAEARRILSNLDLLFPSDFPKVENLDPEETGTTFQENSALKAVAFGDQTQVLSFADDSGLVVEALDGFPGVNSKRFIDGSDIDRNKEILNRLKDEKNRNAKFFTDIAIYDPISKKIDHVQGEVIGKIALSSSGVSGFGYDPIFIPNGYDKSFAELGQDVKNEISHRAVALKQLKKYLLKNELILNN